MSVIKNLLKIKTILILILILYILNSVHPIDKETRIKAINLLKKYDNIGYKVYLKSEKKRFYEFLNNNTYDYGLGTAVHECVHILSGFSGNFDYRLYIPDDSFISVDWYDLYPRSEISSYMEEPQKDTFFQTYLTGSTGNQGLPVLLDELNAYTFSLIHAVNSIEILPRNSKINPRDGLLSFMFYLELYLFHGRLKNKNDYNKIKNNEKYLNAVKILWENAEDILIKSAKYNQLGFHDKYRLKNIYSDKNLYEFKKLYENSDLKINFQKEKLEQLYEFNKELKKSDIPEKRKENNSNSEIITNKNFKININGVDYTLEEIKEKSKTDPMFKQIYDALKQKGIE